MRWFILLVVIVMYMHALCAAVGSKLFPEGTTIDERTHSTSAVLMWCRSDVLCSWYIGRSDVLCFYDHGAMGRTECKSFRAVAPLIVRSISFASIFLSRVDVLVFKGVVVSVVLALVSRIVFAVLTVDNTIRLLDEFFDLLITLLGLATEISILLITRVTFLAVVAFLKLLFRPSVLALTMPIAAAAAA
jgi:hypothetical protein